MQTFPHVLSTELGPLVLKRVHLCDVTAALGILEEAADWLTARDINQWRRGSFQRAAFTERILRGDVYLLWHDEEAVGTLTLLWSDPFFWGDQKPDAGYVHSLAVSRSYAGKRIGRSLLAWAEHVAASEGKQYLRLDCMTENPVLRRYYEAAGFVHQRDIAGNGWRASLYQKTVTPTLR
jgi:ribosomal protein S18 acetylase RimI-like enzyme